MQRSISRRSFAGLMGATGLALAGAAQAQAQATRSAADLAASVPLDVSEIATGGSWTDAGKTGVYRTIVVVTGPNDAPKAHVVVQWIGMKVEGGPTELVKSVDLKDVADATLTNASVAVEAEREDEVTIVVTSYDSDAKPSVLAFKATKPGDVAKTELPPSVQAQPGTKP